MRDSLFTNPEVVPFVECPNCHELLELGVGQCPHCREEIPPEYALMSATVIRHNTQACSVANTISTFDAFIPVALIVLVIVLLVSGSIREWRTAFVIPSLPLLAIIVWFIRFGGFKLGDEDYLKARREMVRSFCFWLALLIVEVLCAVVW